MRGRGATGRDRKGPGDGAARVRRVGRVGRAGRAERAELRA